MKLIENYIICDDDNIFFNGRLMSWQERGQLAKTTKNPELLKILSQKANDVRWHVARNPSTPTDILEKLAQDKRKWVKHWAKQTLKKKKP